MDVRIEDKLPYNPDEDIKANGAVPGDTKARTTSARKPSGTRGLPPASERPTIIQMRQSIEDFYVLTGTLLGQVPNPRMAMVGNSVVMNAEKCAEAIMEAAKKDPRLMRTLIKLTTAGAYSGIFIAHTPIIMAAYVAYQAPDSAFKPPETVEPDNG